MIALTATFVLCCLLFGYERTVKGMGLLFAMLILALLNQMGVL